MAPASGAEAGPVRERLVPVFCDADVPIATAASTTGTSHILFQLSGLTLIDCISSPAAIAHSAQWSTALQAHERDHRSGERLYFGVTCC